MGLRSPLAVTLPVPESTERRKRSGVAWGPCQPQGGGAHLASPASGASTMGLKCAAEPVQAAGSNVAPSRQEG